MKFIFVYSLLLPDAQILYKGLLLGVRDYLLGLRDIENSFSLYRNPKFSGSVYFVSTQP